MRIYLPSDSEQAIGGGWTFQRNFKIGMEKIGHIIVKDAGEADVALVASTSMVTWDSVQEIKDRGLKLIVRLDNVPRNSRNRNTGTSRLKGFCDVADEVVYQCEWARFYLKDFIGREGRVVYNGVDTDIFNKEGEIVIVDRANTYLYSRFNRDETKNWEVAWYKFQLIYRDNPLSKLIIVGKFSPENMEYNFDFFRGENISYLGIITAPEEMAKIYRSCRYLMATYFNDAYSNTYSEALACGMELYEPDMSGGTPELIKNGVITLEQMAKEYEKVFAEVLERK